MSVAAPPQHSCSQCGRTAPRVSRLPAGGGLCRRCYNVRRREECAECGQLRAPSTRTDEGKALCNHCSRPKRICAGCGRSDHIKEVTEAGPLCQRCYQAPERACGRCGAVGPVATRNQRGHTDVCKRCFHTRDVRCALCAQTRPIWVRTWPIGPVCSLCHHRALRAPKPCPACSKPKVLIGLSARGERICGPCAGSAVDYVCKRCGHAGEQHFEQTCLRCSIAVLARDLLATTTGSVPKPFEELPDRLAQRGLPSSTLRWLYQPAPRALLTAIGGQTDPRITHAVVDACSSGQGRHALRAVLVEMGVLPPRNEHLERLDTWVDEFTAQLPSDHAAVIGPYGHWRILRAIRRRAHRKAVTVNTAASARERVRAAGRLLCYAEQRGLPVSSLNQELLDEWTAGSQSRTEIIAPFIRWLNLCGLTEDLKIEHAKSPDPSETSGEDEHHWRIRQLITDTGQIELGTRVAGLLILLYGARINRIHRLTTADVTTIAGRTCLALSAHPIDLPDPIGSLVQDLVNRAQGAPRALTRSGDAHYLFYSPSRAGEPIHPHTLGRKLTDAGIQIRLSRNYAMLALTTDLPAAVVATQLGLRAQTTARWARLSQRDRTEYLIARSQPTAARPARTLQAASDV